MNLKDLTKELFMWSKTNKEQLGFVQDWEYRFDIRWDTLGYIYSIEILEADEGHVLAGANGRRVDDAVEQVALRLPEAFDSWGWPSEFPVRK